jgi:hypothetical protein
MFSIFDNASYCVRKQGGLPTGPPLLAPVWIQPYRGFSFSQFSPVAIPPVKQANHPQVAYSNYYVVANITNTRTKRMYATYEVSCYMQLVDKPNPVLRGTAMPPQVLSLFNHPKFESKSEACEDDIIPVDRKGLPELQATRAVDYFFSKPGMMKPHAYRLQTVRQQAVGDIAAIIRGEHPTVAKATYPQIIKAIDNFHLMATSKDYLPIDKKKVRVGIDRFIYNRFTGKSFLIKLQTPPITRMKETNPKLTKMLKRYYAHEKWGADEKEIHSTEHADFVKASNRIMSYLEENRNALHPHMGLSPERPERAAYLLIKAIKNNSNWQRFETAWLSNDYSIKSLNKCLHDQNFFKPVRLV